MALHVPRSRRDRPPKPPLSREWIVDAAVEVMLSEGLDRVTMRRVAQALDTGPASLYVYLANTAALHGEILDRVLGDLHPTSTGTPSERLEQLLVDYGQLLHRHRGLARSALVLRPAGPNSLRLFDQVMALLLQGGADPGPAAWGADLLLLLVTAGAAEHAQPLSTDLDATVDRQAAWTDLQRAFEDPARTATTPTLAAHTDLVLGGSPGQRIRWKLRAAIAGITQTPLPDHLPDRSSAPGAQENRHDH